MSQERDYVVISDPLRVAEALASMIKGSEQARERPLLVDSSIYAVSNATPPADYYTSDTPPWPSFDFHAHRAAIAFQHGLEAERIRHERRLRQIDRNAKLRVALVVFVAIGLPPLLWAIARILKGWFHP